MKNSFNQQTQFMVNQQGELVSGDNNIVAVLRNHFSDLLNKVVVPNHPQQQNAESSLSSCDPVPPPSLEEIRQVIKEMKNNKSPGENLIEIELLKKADQVVCSLLRDIFAKIWEDEKVPVEWKTATIVPIFKKGDRSLPVNYRGIALLDVGYKIFTKILNNRVREYAEQITGEYQCGFRRARSTLNHIYTASQIIEKNYEFNIKTVALFVDFKQAYDSIIREEMWRALAEVGIPVKYINLVRACYETTECKVKFKNAESEPFPVKNGLRQGDPLAPTLFNLVLESVMRKAGLANPVINQEQPVTLAFADDIVIIAPKINLVKEVCEKLATEAARVGLSINEEKTKFMIINGPKYSQDDREVQTMEVNGMRFQRTGEFKYLGVPLNDKRDAHKIIEERIKCANRCYYSLIGSLKSKLLSHQSKIKIYLAYIRPVLTYGCEAWTLCKGDRKALALFEKKVLRKVFGPVFNQTTNRFERRSSTDLYNRFGRTNVVAFVRAKRIEWFGHVSRDGSVLGMVTNYKPSGVRGRGRPKERWATSVEKDLIKVDDPARRTVPEDRDGWKMLIERALVLNGPLSSID